MDTVTNYHMASSWIADQVMDFHKELEENGNVTPALKTIGRIGLGTVAVGSCLISIVESLVGTVIKLISFLFAKITGASREETSRARTSLNLSVHQFFAGPSDKLTKAFDIFTHRNGSSSRATTREPSPAGLNRSGGSERSRKSAAARQGPVFEGQDD